MNRLLIAARHGETDWNAAGRIQGQRDIPLNEAGRRQVKDAATRIAEYSPTSIWSSDLSRAVDTANALAEIVSLPVSIDERLREIYVGAWEGLDLDEVAERFPEEWLAWKNGEDIRRGGGESRADLAVRVGTAMEEIVNDPTSGNCVAIFGHGLATRCALDWLHQRGVIRLTEPAPRMGNATWVAAEIVSPTAD